MKVDRSLIADIARNEEQRTDAVQSDLVSPVAWALVLVVLFLFVAIYLPW